jgi:hypothetical protein
MTAVSRRVLIIAVTASVPVLLFLNVWQGVRYSRLREDVRLLEEEQTAWFERNKNLLAAVGVYSSPKRLDALAAKDPELTKSISPDVMRVDVEKDGSAPGTLAADGAAGKAPQ